MIILDTNVLSEVLRPIPEGQVLAWLAGQWRAAVFTSTITRAEILYGIQTLPAGQRKEGLRQAARGILDQDFAGQVLGFDSDAANAFAIIAAERHAAGRPISQFDAMIAAITRSRGASLATRNVKDFAGCGISLINPWESVA